MFVDYDFFDTMEMTLAEGRGFSRDFPSDTSAFILNQAALRGVGWDEDVGKRLGQPIGANSDDFLWGDVVGVVEDFNFASMHQQVEPMAISLGRFPMQYLAVRIRPGDIAATLSTLETTWAEFLPNQPFEYTFLDQSFDAQYKSEENLGQVFSSFALFAILIACLGLFGLASFTAEQRRKEIGVRKALGASVLQIVVLLSREFITLVLLALVIGGIAAFFFMEGWLEEFAYRTDIGPGVFALAGVLALLIAGLTVSYQAIRAALADPVKSLRYE
jgi:putative ABC transport system permease protein